MLSSKSTKSADILTLIEGNLQIARNVVIILEEETSQPPRNQSGTVHAPFFSWVCLTFLVRSCKTSTKDDRCFVEKEGDCVLLATAVHKRASYICIVGRAANSSCKHACRPLLRCLSCQFQTFHFSAAKVESYNEDSPSLSALLRADSTLPAVFQVSYMSFFVPGFPSSNNTLGYCHVTVN